MNVCIVQPPYSTDYSQSEAYFLWEMNKMDECDECMDIIVFPESCDVPCYADSKEKSDASSEKYAQRVLQKASETAKRCNAIVVVNVHFEVSKGLRRNSTLVFNRAGENVGR